MGQQKQESLADMSAGIGIALSLLFGVNRTVQIWSRQPGTTGTWYFGFYYFVGAMFQAWYCELNLYASMRSDQIPPHFIIGMSVVWFAVHGISRACFFLRGVRFHSYDPGIGFLAPLCPPTWRCDNVGLLSDLTTAIGLSLAFRFFASPILSGWFAAMSVWLIVAHAWSHARDERMQIARDDAQIEAQQWSHSQKH